MLCIDRYYWTESSSVSCGPGSASCEAVHFRGIDRGIIEIQSNFQDVFQHNSVQSLNLPFAMSQCYTLRFQNFQKALLKPGLGERVP